MKCKRCGKDIQPLSQVNKVWVHIDTNSIMCIHPAVPMFAQPLSKEEAIGAFKAQYGNVH